jgi:hypothetical protein
MLVAFTSFSALLTHLMHGEANIPIIPFLRTVLHTIDANIPIIPF